MGGNWQTLFETNSVTGVVADINDQLSSSSVSDATAVRVSDHFEIRLPRTHSGLTIGGAEDKDVLFSTLIAP